MSWGEGFHPVRQAPPPRAMVAEEEAHYAVFPEGRPVPACSPDWHGVMMVTRLDDVTCDECRRSYPFRRDWQRRVAR